MATKGINTIVKESKKEILDAINGSLNKGLPISVVSLIVESLVFELNNNLVDTLVKENEEYQQQLQVESEQVEYVKEDENS